MKLFLSSMLVLTLGGGGYFFWKHRPVAEAASQKVERPTTAIVETRDIHFAVTAAGDIGPADQVSVRPEINGKLSQLPVDLGDTVKKGELLCVLDDQELVDERLSKTKILAPFDCTVLTRPVSLGQTVSGSAGFNSGTEIMTIANLTDMIINAHINQSDVTRLHTNQWV